MNCCFCTVGIEKTLESSLDCKELKEILKEINPGYSLEGLMLKLKLQYPRFFDDSMDVGNLISGSSAFSNSSFNIWKPTVHVLLKPALENFKCYVGSM